MCKHLLPPKVIPSNPNLEQKKVELVAKNQQAALKVLFSIKDSLCSAVVVKKEK